MNNEKKNVISKLIRKLVPDNVIVSAMSLYPGKSREEVADIIIRGLLRKLKGVPLAAAVILLLFAILDIRQRNAAGDPYEIIREDVNGSERHVEVTFETEDGEKNGTVSVSAVVMTDEAIDEMQLEVSDYLDRNVIGENTAFNEVLTDLVFFDRIDGLPVEIIWQTDDRDIVAYDGHVNNEELLTSVNVLIRAKVFYGEEFRVYERTVTVCPKSFGTDALVKKGLREIEKMQENDRESSVFTIPENILGMKVTVTGEKTTPYLGLGLVMALLVFIYIYSAYFSDLKTKKGKRLSEAKRDYKGFVSMLSLLLTAGMSLRTAWKKLAKDYSEKGKNERMLSQVLKVSSVELDNGVPEQEVYERFGERMEDLSYQRLASILSQQATKGVSELVNVLNMEVKEAVAKEKEEVRIRGEETGTKLLMPMMGMLAIVFAILLVPAFTSF